MSFPSYQVDLPCTNQCKHMAAKRTLRTLAELLPEDARIPMLLGLDGDCDFSRRLTVFLPHLCERKELLALIDRDPALELPPVHGLPDFLVLCRRHAVWVPGLTQKKTMGD